MKVTYWLLFTVSWVTDYIYAEHSIMDMIDTQRLEKLIAQQRKTTHAESPHVDVLDDSEQESQQVLQEGSILKKGRKHHRNSIADVTRVLAALRQSPRSLKADQTNMLVTKKAFIRKDWCKTEPIVQKILEDGCRPKNVVNRFCYGQCNSFFIPRNFSARKVQRKRPENAEDAPAFRSCGVCKPKKLVWVQVSLHCPGTVSPLRRRKVQKVKQCQCLAENGPL